MTNRFLIGRTVVATAALVSAALVGATGPAEAASSKGCTGGGFSLGNLSSGATVVAPPGKDRVRTTIAASRFGTTIAVRGRYTQFDVRLADFAVLKQSFTGAANPLD